MPQYCTHDATVWCKLTYEVIMRKLTALLLKFIWDQLGLITLYFKLQMWTLTMFSMCKQGSQCAQMWLQMCKQLHSALPNMLTISEMYLLNLCWSLCAMHPPWKECKIVIFVPTHAYTSYVCDHVASPRISTNADLSTTVKSLASTKKPV